MDTRRVNVAIILLPNRAEMQDLDLQVGCYSEDRYLQVKEGLDGLRELPYNLDMLQASLHPLNWLLESGQMYDSPAYTMVRNGNAFC